ncbi:MAG TPA: asparagine synthase (glutamine-hydrolyzing) [Candidatus Cybelea sp.]|nr:asparagine synthase (glutamine-hydrolyzing) [Candidatus Cybelea sp.]
MCGICGVIGSESNEHGEAIVRRMLGSMVHRGPDGEGRVVVERAALGARRLSIIDLPGGSQPIWNEDSTVAVVFNGEIYNFRGLRGELESLGHRFRTSSDTEVIAHAYEAWGAQCVERLEGMFAFAVVELAGGPRGRAAKVFLARDRLGIKPLYYSVAAGKVYLASEVRALTASGCLPLRISAEAIRSYLLFGSVLEPLTIIAGVLSLPPGHRVLIDPANPEVKPSPYWNFEACRRKLAANGTSSPSGRVRAILEKAVDAHLVADVPVGVFLSSGIDSTAIAALASRARGGIHTFTVAFPEAEFNEAEIARRTAKRLGTSHSEISVSGEQMVSRLEEAIAAFDQPTADAVNTYFVSWAARQAGLKVALSGLGSDELFGGYRTFRATRQVAWAQRAARFVPRKLRSYVGARIEQANFSPESPDARRKILAAWRDPDVLPHAYFFTRTLFTPGAITWALSSCDQDDSSPAWSVPLASTVRELQSIDSFTAVSWLELRSYLVNTLLRDTDVMSMSHSLEVRVPFLDLSLVEYVLSLPESLKAKASTPKSLLIESVRDLLPEEVTSQAKRTFTFPWSVWLRGDLGKRVGASLREWSPELAMHVDADFARGVWQDFLNGRTTWSRPWSLYVLNEWTKQAFARSPVREAQRAAQVRR